MQVSLRVQCFVVPSWDAWVLILCCILSCICWTILSMDFFLGPGCDMKSFWKLEVTIVMGLCCGNWIPYLLTPRWQSYSMLISQCWSDFRLGFCCFCLTCSSLDCANAACFDLTSNLDDFWMLLGFPGFVLSLGAFCGPFSCGLLLNCCPAWVRWAGYSLSLVRCLFFFGLSFIYLKFPYFLYNSFIFCNCFACYEFH